MWLPRDERKLLRAYYSKLEKPGKEGWYKDHILVKVLKARMGKKSIEELKDYLKDGSGEDQSEETDSDEERKRRNNNFIKNIKRVEIANANLEQRKLITIKPHQHERRLNKFTLTLDGSDLARKYSKVFTRTGEWWAEYKGHWLWVVIGYILAFVMGRLTK